MDKEAKPPAEPRKFTNYFCYEMKSTNQLLKDFISSSMKQESFPPESSKHQTGRPIKLEESSASYNFQEQKNKIFKKEEEYHHRQVLKKAVKYQEDLQNEQNSDQKCLIEDSSFSLQRKKNRQNSMEDLILQKFHISSSENQDYDDGYRNSIQKYKSKDFLDHNTLDRYDDSYKEIKKQRKGLANISLRVKNIVSEHKKLTYRQVSDYVLQYSQEQINLLDPVQRTKQIKNIKRRVYDALNVLVAVGILGKHQRCVCTTEWTEIPGKKHSSQWHKINSKIEYLNKLRRNCDQKTRTLNQYIEKFHAISALRNKHLQEPYDRDISKDNNKLQSPRKQVKISNSELKEQVKRDESELKLGFPVIVFYLGEYSNQKITVNLEEEDDDQSRNGKGSHGKKSKIKISGKNLAMMGDFDCAIWLQLHKYRVAEQEEKTLREIEDYAKEKSSKKVSGYKYEVEDIGEASIEEYFDAQMFQSK